MPDDSLRVSEKAPSGSLGPPPQGEGVQICPPPRWGTADTEDIPPPHPRQVGSQGYQRFPLSKPVVGQNISFASCACLQGFFQPSVCLPGSFNFISPKFLKSSMVECVLSSESEYF